MNTHTCPVYTEVTGCQDCYKCLRGCPVKAIRIEQSRAMVIPEECILCGNCVETCPVEAKKVRDDLGRAQFLIQQGRPVFASLAPSWISAFPGISPAAMVQSLYNAGFAGVSETALGAEEVSAHAAQLLEKAQPGVHISTACPVVVELISKYYPHLAGTLMPLVSPAEAHARLLRREFGEEIAVVFIGPCIAKKHEADAPESGIDIAITFDDVHTWLGKNGYAQPAHGAAFIPKNAGSGVLYPVDGGMIAGIGAADRGICCMSFSGITQIKRALEQVDALPADSTVFLELLACEGGCVNGPAAGSRTASAFKRYAVLHQGQTAPDPDRPRLDISKHYAAFPVVALQHESETVRGILRSIGKHCLKDELNCGGCGYERCRDFAAAMLEGKAEQTMCVSYMRSLAQKKANALIQTMPSGVVIVDRELCIVECNAQFAALMGEDTVLEYAASPGLAGVNVSGIVPFAELFRTVLDIGDDILNRDIRNGKQVLHVSVFSIEAHQYAGAVIQDITTPVVQKEHIISRARQVIKQNLETVQKIAYLLGENASETEVILGSIVASFEESGNEHDAAGSEQITGKEAADAAFS